MMNPSSHRQASRRAGWRALVVLACVALTACGSADEENEANVAAEAVGATAATDAARCPRGDELIARVRALQEDGSDSDVERFTRAIQAGADRAVNDSVEDKDGRQGCAGYQTLSPSQTETYVDLLYNGRPAMAPALVFGQTEAARRAILNAYRDDPDAVTSNPGLAAALAMAQIGSGQSYEAAYEDLAFAALNDGIAPGYVRGYLSHFGCDYEDAVWAAKTKKREDFLEGDPFPTSTSPEQTGDAALIADRMALLQRGEVPALRAECPLSVQHATDRNGDTLARFKLQARRWADQLHNRLGAFADGLGEGSEPDDTSSKDEDQQNAFTLDPGWLDMDALGTQMLDRMQALGDAAQRAGNTAGARLQACRQRLEQGFAAVVDCFKDEGGQGDTSTDESKTENDTTTVDS